MSSKNREKRKRIQASEEPVSVDSSAGEGRTKAWLLLLALAATFVAYIPALGAGFVNLDDTTYVTENKLLSDPSRLLDLLRTPCAGNFHPLTMLSLSLNHAISGLEPWSYHLLNVLLHLLNVWLAWRLAWRLSRGDMLVSFGTALFFGVHPMHVESVAWVSERKDVLYTAFFLAGLELWTKYVDDRRRTAYVGALVLMVFSGVSKPAAVVFPLVLIAIDHFRERKLSLSVFLEKLPFFAVAAALALLTRGVQAAAGAIANPEMFSLQRRMAHAAYGLMMYFVKAVFPYPLVAFYPIPDIKSPLPYPYLIAPFFCAAVALFGWFFARKNRVVPFALLFYLINLVLVIQLIPIGSAVIADRYSYVPYWGLFFGASVLAVSCFSRSTIRRFSIVAGGVCVLFSFRQASVWRNGETLWDHANALRPSYQSHLNRGLLYREASKQGGPDARVLADQAFDQFTEALRLNPKGDVALSRRGNLYFIRGQYELAIADYDKALAVNPDEVSTLDNRGAVHGARGEADLAYADFARALQLDPTHASVYKNRAKTLFGEKRFEEAIVDGQKFLMFEPNDTEVLNLVANSQLRLGQYEAAIATLDQAIRLSPRGLFFMNRAIANFNLRRIGEARRDAELAAKAGEAVSPAFQAALDQASSGAAASSTGTRSP